MISFAGIAQTPEEKLAQMGITLPPAPNPAANYVNAVRTGNLLFLAGKGPTTPDGKYITGKVGTDDQFRAGLYGSFEGHEWLFRYDGCCIW